MLPDACGRRPAGDRHRQAHISMRPKWFFKKRHTRSSCSSISANPVNSSRVAEGQLSLLDFVRTWQGVFVSNPSVKDRLLEIAQQLPPDATIEDAMERLYFLAKIDRGLAEADAGKTVSHDEVKARLRL